MRTDADAGGLPACVPDCGLPEWQTTVHAPAALCVVSNTGALQGTFSPPFLFTLYSMGFNYFTDSCHLQKFLDDSTALGCISGVDDEIERRAAVGNYVT